MGTVPRMEWYIQAPDGTIMGPFTSSQLQLAFLQGKLGLDSKVRLSWHVGFKPFMAYFHLIDEDRMENSKQEAARREALVRAQQQQRQQQQQQRRKSQSSHQTTMQSADSSKESHGSPGLAEAAASPAEQGSAQDGQQS
mmetsp:Transcript_20313/g.44382  ORF Transcript_20313/g.44382 Transcript_20313/m.44382 type:complete len:139 (+) Transcript_20313:74-490(+)